MGDDYRIEHPFAGPPLLDQKGADMTSPAEQMGEIEPKRVFVEPMNAMKVLIGLNGYLRVPMASYAPKSHWTPILIVRDTPAARQALGLEVEDG